MTSTKQVYEWVKTGHWSLAQFSAWAALQKQGPTQPGSIGPLGSAEMAEGLTLILTKDKAAVRTGPDVDLDAVSADKRDQEKAKGIIDLLSPHFSRRMNKWFCVAALDELHERMDGLHRPGLMEVKKAAEFLNPEPTMPKSPTVGMLIPFLGMGTTREQATEAYKNLVEIIEHQHSLKHEAESVVENDSGPSI